MSDAAAREPSDVPDLRASITRLAQFRPHGAGKLQIEFVLRDLVLTAAYEAGHAGLSSLSACRDACRALWGIDTEIDELRSVTTSLVDEGKLTKTGGTLRLTDEARAELTERITDSDKTEGEALADWEIAVRRLDRSIQRDQLDVLRKDLDAWLQQIAERYSVEAVMLLYPEDERGSALLEKIESYGLNFLPEREAHLQELRPQALYLFIHHPTAAQRAYLANLMSTAYMVASFTLDPRASAHLQQLTAGQRVYLDTNIVYAALNLQGPQAYLSATRILKLTQGLGYELAVTPWTVAEMKESLRRARGELHKTSLPPRALAELAAEATGEESFVTAYWRKYKATGVSVEDFSAMYTELDALIEKLGIAIVDQSCKAIDANEVAINEQLSLIERCPGGQFKSDPVKLHDVKHRLLVERLRGDGDRPFSKAGYWFLTRDSVLIPYGRAGRRNEDTLPFAVSMTAWAQIVRAFTPRTEDYDQTLVDLLDTPSIRPKGMVSYQTVADVLGRVDLMVADSSEEIAARLLLDHAAMAEIDNSTGDERETMIGQAITTKTDEMQRQLAEAEAARIDETASRQAAERQTAAIEAERDERAAEAQRLSEQLHAEQAARQKAEQTAQESDRAAAEAIAETQGQYAQELASIRADLDRQKKIARYTLAAVLFLLALAIVVVPLVTGWVSGGWGWVAVIAVGGAIAFLALRLLIGTKAAVVGGAVLLLVGSTADLHSLSPRDHHTSKPKQAKTK